MDFTPESLALPAPVRVLLAVASPLTVRAIETLLAGTPDIEIVAVAPNGREALALLSTTRPHLLVTDDALPVMSGLELTGEAMRAHPCPIVVLCDAVMVGNEAKKRAFVEAGALELLRRPSLADSFEARIAGEFAAHLKMLARVPVIGRRPLTKTLSVPKENVALAKEKLPLAARETAARIVAIGASTGGPGAMLSILAALPADFPLPIVCVQHVSHGFLAGLITWLDDSCRLCVRIARDGEPLRAGNVLFPPENRHLEITDEARVRLSDGPPCDGHRPSVSVLFQSLARAVGANTTAILLSGMGADGAAGLEAIFHAGGDTFAQDEASCVVFGMPRVAIERGAARHIAPPLEIARRLLAMGR